MNGFVVSFAVCLLARTGLGGGVLFLLPPFGEFPPAWQIQLAFAIWLGCCYWHGLFGSARLSLVAAEFGDLALAVAELDAGVRPGEFAGFVTAPRARSGAAR